MRQDIKEYLESLSDENYIELKPSIDTPISTLLDICSNIGSYFGCIKGNIELMKYYFFNYSLTYLFENNYRETHKLGLGIYHFMYPLVSDNLNIIKKFIRISENFYNESAEDGEGEAFTKCIQSFLKNDRTEIKKYLGIIETKMLRKVEYKEMFFEYEFLVALYGKDLNKVKNAIIDIGNSPFHEERQLFFSKYYSKPQATFAKLSWILGIQVDLDSPIIPKEWLPIKPIKEYEIRYDFLKEFSKNNFNFIHGTHYL